MISEGFSFLCLASGAFFLIVGGIGLLRLPDMFTRLHAAGVADTMGAGLILIGLMLHSGFTQATVKLILILVFLVLTGPTATHALAKAARHGKLSPVLHRLETPKQSQN